MTCEEELKITRQFIHEQGLEFALLSYTGRLEKEKKTNEAVNDVPRIADADWLIRWFERQKHLKGLSGLPQALDIDTVIGQIENAIITPKEQKE